MMSHYIWLIEFLTGMVIAFYVTSHKFRTVVNYFIFRRNHQPSIEERLEDEEKIEGEVEAPEFAAYLKKHPDIEISGRGK